MQLDVYRCQIARHSIQIRIKTLSILIQSLLSTQIVFLLTNIGIYVFSTQILCTGFFQISQAYLMGQAVLVHIIEYHILYYFTKHNSVQQA